MIESGSDVLANELATALLAGATFPLPVVDLTGSDYALPDLTAGELSPTVTSLNNDALTTRTVGGTGTFDALMESVAAHIRAEYDANRISGAEYTKAYIAVTQAAMANATQFLLGRDTIYWQSVAAKLEAKTRAVALVTAKVELATAKANLQAMNYTAKNAEANYALTKLKLATEDVAYASANYSLDFLLPQQLKALQEQTEAQRAQTSDTRMDGTTPVTGVLGKQKELYAQQITSYKRDAEVKAMKIFSDAWITMKTIDEGLLPPTNFQNASLDAMLADIKANNDLGVV